MTKRTFVLLSIFIFLVIFGGVFMSVYKLYWNERIVNYINELKVCGFLAESACQSNTKCEAIYKENSRLGKFVEYDKCQLIPEHKKNNLSQAQELCKKTNGEWEKLKTGYYCNCVLNGNVLVWDKDSGCKRPNLFFRKLFPVFNNSKSIGIKGRVEWLEHSFRDAG